MDGVWLESGIEESAKQGFKNHMPLCLTLKWVTTSIFSYTGTAIRTDNAVSLKIAS